MTSGDERRLKEKLRIREKRKNAAYRSIENEKTKNRMRKLRANWPTRPMKKTSISDEKRVVRGLHYERVQSALRARDCVHHGAWHFLTVAGPSPNEEIECIRELFRNAIITSVDLDESNLSAAIDAGADEIIHCDLFDFQIIERQYAGKTILPPSKIGVERRFDVICLDLTGHATPALRDLIRIYWKILAPRGAMIVTFSYGRDVIEAYQYEWESSLENIHWERAVADKSWLTAAERGMYQLQRLRGDGISESVMARIHYLLGSRCEYLWSVLQYSGKQMPMLSCLLNKWTRAASQPPRFGRVSETDFALAVTAEPRDPSKIFACPQDRILELRRSLAGVKAAATRKLITANKGNGQKLLEFHPQPAVDCGSTTRQMWSASELDRLRQDYPNHEINVDDLAAQMGRAPGALRQKAFLLGIVRGTPHKHEATTQLSMEKIINEGNEQ